MQEAVSVYIPTHNRPDFLDRALNSLCEQNYKNLQVLVCDDGSQKSYYQVIEKYKNKFSDFICVKNEEPKGACFSRNRLIEMADGKYITGLDDDDEFLPSRIDIFVNATEKSKYAFLCAGHVTKTKKGKFKQPMKAGVITLDDMLNRNYVGNQIFTETSLIRELGGFDVSLPSWQDYDAWLRMCKEYGSGFKLEAYTYQLNIDHEEGRISDSPKAKQGYEMFIKKHGYLMNEANLASLFFQDKVNRKQDITISELLSHFNGDTFKMYCKNKINTTFPFIKQIIYRP
ncbi:glycosyltransferase [Sodalis sp. RH14]|uniref:glycosyltransferase n=1 Tax=Sodalis sp. RH14 TaxID=3394329 RepID=UPI0039B36E21